MRYLVLTWNFPRVASREDGADNETVLVTGSAKEEWFNRVILTKFMTYDWVVQREGKAFHVAIDFEEQLAQPSTLDIDFSGVVLSLLVNYPPHNENWLLAAELLCRFGCFS